MAIFRCDGFRPVEADSHGGAMEIFARRFARRTYGKRGHARTIRRDSWSEDLRTVTFQAFIGRPVPGDQNTTAGRNEWFHISRVG